MADTHRLETHPIHLGSGAVAISEPEFPRDERAMQWYADYAVRHAEDGTEARLVSMFRFTEDWSGWEMHPEGDEVVVCIAGEMELIQEHPGGSEKRVRLVPGDYAINPAGVWHTANIAESATALFITPGMDTEGRPRG